MSTNMNAFRTLLFVSVTIFFGGGCTQQISTESKYKNLRIKLQHDVAYSSRVENYAIPGDYGEYVKIFDHSDYFIGFSSHKNCALDPEISMSVIRNESTPIFTKTGAEDVTISYDVTINDFPVINDVHFLKTKSDDNISNLFGSVVNLSINNSPRTKADGENVSMYIPEKIHILSPKIVDDSDLLPLCYYRNFQIRWNYDECNENGVLIIFKWDGNMLFGNDIPNTQIQRVCKVDDTGEAIINEALFKDIPDTAICRIILLRGSLEETIINDDIFKIVGETHEVLSFTLIKWIKNV